MTHDVGDIAFFAGIDLDPAGDLHRLMRWLRVKKSQVLLSDAEPSTDVFFPVDGGLRLEMHAANGKLVTLRDIRPGEPVGELTAIDGQARAISLVATDDCLVLVVPASALRAALAASRELTDRMMGHLTKRIRTMTNRIFELAALDVRSRIMSDLLRRSRSGAAAPQGGVVIRPAPTHEMIAHQVGTHREAVTRTFSWLEQEGVIQRRRGEIHVVDGDALAGLVQRAGGADFIAM